VNEQEKEIEKILETMIIYLAMGKEEAWVNLRKVWEFLGVKEKLPDWYKRRFAENGGVEGLNYVLFKGGIPVTGSEISLDPKSQTANSTGVTETGIAGMVPFQPTECLVTLEMVALICSSERTNMGLFCRRFFLRRSVEFEKARIAGTLAPPVFDLEAALKLALEGEQARKVLEQKNTKLFEHATKLWNSNTAALEYADEVEDIYKEDAKVVAVLSTCGGSWVGSDVAKRLNVPVKTFFDALKASKHVFYRSGCDYLVPDAYLMGMGYASMGEYTITHKSGRKEAKPQLLFTDKGRVWSGLYLEKAGYIKLDDATRAWIKEEKVRLKAELLKAKEVLKDLEGVDGRHIQVSGQAGNPAVLPAGPVLPIHSQNQPAPPVVDTPAVPNGSLRPDL
jgi:phage antirepressor YoqD-like protein